jgi:hypothetical protein
MLFSAVGFTSFELLKDALNCGEESEVGSMEVEVAKPK